MKWKPQNMRLLLLNPKTQALLTRKAKAIAAACGGDEAGYVARGASVGSRARAAVITATGAAIRDNAANNTLVRNLDAGKAD